MYTYCIRTEIELRVKKKKGKEISSRIRDGIMSIEIKRWKVFGGVNEKNLLENGIPSHMRHQVQMALISGTLSRVPFLKQMSSGIIHSLTGHAKLEVTKYETNK